MKQDCKELSELVFFERYCILWLMQRSTVSKQLKISN